MIHLKANYDMKYDKIDKKKLKKVILLSFFDNAFQYKFD